MLCRPWGVRKAGARASAWEEAEAVKHFASPHAIDSAGRGLPDALGRVSTAFVVFTRRWSQGEAQKCPKSACEREWRAGTMHDLPQTDRVE